jgi:hypothetical protein
MMTARINIIISGLLLIWFNLGSIYWPIKVNDKKKLRLLERIEKRLAALEKNIRAN